MKKLKPTDLEGFVHGEHQPYTDYNEDIMNWLKDNAKVSIYIGNRNYIFTQEENFYTHNICFATDIYYTNEQFMELIGMTKKNEFDSLLEQAHSLVKQIEDLWNKAKSQIDPKQQAIQKELEFAEAKKQRLEAHINVLKSKLK